MSRIRFPSEFPKNNIGNMTGNLFIILFNKVTLILEQSKIL